MKKPGEEHSRDTIKWFLNAASTVSAVKTSKNFALNVLFCTKYTDISRKEIQ